MAPELLSKTRALLDKEIKEVQGNNISSLFSLTEDPEIEEVPYGYIVSFRGRKVVYLGKENIQGRDIVYRVRLKTMPPTETNPYGLVVEKVHSETVVDKAI